MSDSDILPEDKVTVVDSAYYWAGAVKYPVQVELKEVYRIQTISLTNYFLYVPEYGRTYAAAIECCVLHERASKPDISLADGNFVRLTERQARNIISNHIRDNLDTFGVDADFVLVLPGDE